MIPRSPNAGEKLRRWNAQRLGDVEDAIEQYSSAAVLNSNQDGARYAR